jgi:hypothetical protein
MLAPGRIAGECSGQIRFNPAHLFPELRYLPVFKLTDLV